VYTRPYEAVFRDPWWVFTTINLIWQIKTKYDFGMIELFRVSPRFAILLGSMVLSICFIITDILSVTHVISAGLPDGLNPFWKFAFVFKCLTDTVILDDFKTALDRLKQYKLERMGSVFSDGLRDEIADVRQAKAKKSDHLDLQAMQHNSHVQTQDWTKVSDRENLDLEAALRMEYGQHPHASGSSTS